MEIVFYGTEGGAAWRNVNGSFHDFTAEHFDGTSRQVLARPPDDWAGRTITRWIGALRESNRFDPEVETNLLTSAALDAIYDSVRV